MNRLLREQNIITTPETANQKSLLANLGDLSTATKTMYIDMLIKAGQAKQLEPVASAFITGKKLDKAASSKMMQ